MSSSRKKLDLLALLQCNGYPHNFIRKQLTKFQHNKQGEPKTESQLQDLPKFGPNKKDVYIVLPFCGNQSLKLQRQLERILSKIAPYVYVGYHVY